VIEYCLSFDNTGSGFMICQFGGASLLANNTVRYSVSIGDGCKFTHNPTAACDVWLDWNGLP
jgi:hypothetical protein